MSAKRASERLTVRGYVAGECVSALQKAIRRGQEPEAVWWAAELDQSGFGDWCWSRVIVITSEDVGLAWPEGPAVIRALREAAREARKRKHPVARLYLVHAVMLLARAPKSRRADEALWWAYGSPVRRFEIPDAALDWHTARGIRMGRGQEHWLTEASKLEGEVDFGPEPYTEAVWGPDGDVCERWFDVGWNGWAEPPLEPLIEPPDDEPAEHGEQPQLGLDEASE